MLWMQRHTGMKQYFGLFSLFTPRMPWEVTFFKRFLELKSEPVPVLPKNDLDE